MTVTFYILGTIFALVCVFLMLLILIQKGRGGGLSSAFGGAGGNTAFGTKTGDVLTWATSIVFVLFLLLGMGLVWTGKSLAANTGAPPTAAPEEEEVADEEVGDEGTAVDETTAEEPAAEDAPADEPTDVVPPADSE